MAGKSRQHSGSVFVKDIKPKFLCLTKAVNFFNRKGFGNRNRIFLSMNLGKHEYYGRLIAYERQKAERAGYKRSRPAILSRKPEGIAGEVALNSLTNESPTSNEAPPI